MNKFGFHYTVPKYIESRPIKVLNFSNLALKIADEIDGFLKKVNMIIANGISTPIISNKRYLTHRFLSDKGLKRKVLPVGTMQL